MLWGKIEVPHHRCCLSQGKDTWLRQDEHPLSCHQAVPFSGDQAAKLPAELWSPG